MRGPPLGSWFEPEGELHLIYGCRAIWDFIVALEAAGSRRLIELLLQPSCDEHNISSNPPSNLPSGAGLQHSLIGRLYSAVLSALKAIFAFRNSMTYPITYQGQLNDETMRRLARLSEARKSITSAFLLVAYLCQSVPSNAAASPTRTDLINAALSQGLIELLASAIQTMPYDGNPRNQMEPQTVQDQHWTSQRATLYAVLSVLAFGDHWHEATPEGPCAPCSPRPETRLELSCQRLGRAIDVHPQLRSEVASSFFMLAVFQPKL